jgi:hypothetical protein
MRNRFFRTIWCSGRVHPLTGAFFVMFCIGLASCAGKHPSAESAGARKTETADSKAAGAVFQLGGLSYYMPESFEVAESFTLTGGMAAYTAAEGSRLLKIVITPVVPQTAIPYELTRLTWSGDDGTPSVGSFSIESFSGSRDSQTDPQIISRSTLQKDGVSMLYLSHILYVPIRQTDKTLTVKYEDAVLFGLDLEKSEVK